MLVVQPCVYFPTHVPFWPKPRTLTSRVLHRGNHYGRTPDNSLDNIASGSPLCFVYTTHIYREGENTLFRVFDARRPHDSLTNESPLNGGLHCQIRSLSQGNTTPVTIPLRQGKPCEYTPFHTVEYHSKHSPSIQLKAR